LKILLVGLGSIGKRHLSNIINLGYNDVSVVTRSGVLPQPFAHLKAYPTVNAALQENNFDAAIICTPTAQHTLTVLQLLQANTSAIYLEKPVSHSYENIQEIATLAEKNKTHFVVGYDLHFDVGLQKVKELLAANAIGKLISANAQVGQYLPDWRPHEDYSKGMSAKVETGGGVMLDLVHEFDYLHWLVGEVETIASINKNSGALAIETEDTAEVLLKFSNGVTGTIHLDYLQQKLVRNCMFTGSIGTIFWNLAESKVNWINNQKEENEYAYKGFERNDRFVAIMKAFLAKTNDDRLTSLQDGLTSLKMVLAAKYSSQHSVFVQMNQFNP
jgi:predicted dehydrogenase